MSEKKFRPPKSARPAPNLKPDAATHPAMHAADDDLTSSPLPMLTSPQSGAAPAQDLHLGGLSRHWRQPRDEFEEARLDYILTDLNECLAFAGIVEAESRAGNREHAERTLAALEECYSDMLRFYHQADILEPGTKTEFESKFKRVRERLDEIRDSI